MTSREFQIAVFAGDGIGPEIMKEALKVLRVISDKHHINLVITEGLHRRQRLRCLWNAFS